MGNELSDPSQKPGSLESVMTSTNIKLYQHLDRLADAQRGIWKPISLQLSPTDACDYECTFCSVGHRNYSEVFGTKQEFGKTKPAGIAKRPDQLSFDDVAETVQDLMEVGPLRTVEITGGGNPVLFPEINGLITYLVNEGLEVGLITNNPLDRITQTNLDKLTWLRISLAYLDKENFFRPSKAEPIKIPNIKGDLGFSYVWNQYSTPEKLEVIAELAQQHKASMVRIVPNCFNPQEQFEYRERITPLIQRVNERIGREVLFFQGKDYGVHSKCYVGKIKPYLNSDGFFYHCSAVPLYNHKFTSHWRMGHMSEVKKIWSQENDKSFDTSKCVEGKCFYRPQNIVLHSLKITPPHRGFI